MFKQLGFAGLGAVLGLGAGYLLFSRSAGTEPGIGDRRAPPVPQTEAVVLERSRARDASLPEAASACPELREQVAGQLRAVEGLQAQIQELERRIEAERVSRMRQTMEASQ